MIGEIFLNAGVVTPGQLDEALAIQDSERPVRRLGEILVSLGHTQEVEVAQALARQRRLKFLSLEPGSINADAAHLISGRLAEMHMCIPVREHDGDLIVAMENPLDLIAIEDVERASERRVRPAVSTISAIQAAIANVYAGDHERV
jgi:type IV pilus assembly protein PilB